MPTPTPTPKSSQEMNESLDRLHPEYGQYVLVNTDKGSVSWYENYDSAIRDQTQYGGTVINTRTADPEFVRLTIDNALRNM